MQWGQLRDQMCDWDPIGIMGLPDAPRDEYDCLVGGLLSRLRAHASVTELAEYLRTEIVDHFGLSPDAYDFDTVATRAKAWFELAWKTLRDPVIIYVALLDEDVPCWRPVQARPLGGDVYRICGVAARVDAERWQFPMGSVVRCASRVLDGGVARLTAFEEVPTAN